MTAIYFIDSFKIQFLKTRFRIARIVISIAAMIMMRMVPTDLSDTAGTELRVINQEQESKARIELRIEDRDKNKNISPSIASFSDLYINIPRSFSFCIFSV